MARPSIDVEPYKTTLITLVSTQGYNHALSWLLSTHNIRVSLGLLRRRMRQWEQPLKLPRVIKSEDMVKFVEKAFMEDNLKDKDILEMLRLQGFEIGYDNLQELRRTHGLYRRRPAEKKAGRNGGDKKGGGEAAAVAAAAAGSTWVVQRGIFGKRAQTRKRDREMGTPRLYRIDKAGKVTHAPRGMVML